MTGAAKPYALNCGSSEHSWRIIHDSWCILQDTAVLFGVYILATAVEPSFLDSFASPGHTLNDLLRRNAWVFHCHHDFVS